MATFSREVIALAKDTQDKYGVPASVTLAQYALESNYGKSTLAKTKNNYFGMRNGSKGWQTFDSMEDSFEAHGKLLASDLYASKVSNATTVQEYVEGIAETYAPSSDGNSGYSQKILSIIEDNNLTQYDNGTYSSDFVAIETSNNDGKYDGVVTTIFKFLAILFVFIMAVVFFMSAFDIKLPKVGPL